ncbi:MAG: helix-turn-helix transcriptional regulator [Oscillospiraceae bacterium]|nr:helix-turn-helix transcriptional regulator [Oscillospiraceae bacterium]
MTLGQRIQELRRSRGLSQEGLGDLLGVSRQAISKWESDTTIPEVDKLIAISRQFEISVGALLGVEENIPQSEQEDTSGELTERELAAVEAIAGRYLEQLQQVRPQPEKQPRRWKWAAIVLAVLLVISWSSVSKLNRRIDDLSGKTQNVQNQLVGVENTVSNQINSLTGRLERLLEAQNHLLSEWDCILIGYIPGEKAVFSLSARPKEYVPGMTAEFYVENNAGEQVSVPARWDGSAFEAQMDVPLWDDPDFSIQLYDGQSRKTQPMEVPGPLRLKSDFGLRVSETGSVTSTTQLTKKNILILDKRINFTLKAQMPGTLNLGLLYPTQLTAVVRYGSEELLRRDLSVENWQEFDEISEWEWWFDLVGEFPVKGEDTLTAEVIVTDSFGTTTHWDVLHDKIKYE